MFNFFGDVAQRVGNFFTGSGWRNNDEEEKWKRQEREKRERQAKIQQSQNQRAAQMPKVLTQQGQNQWLKQNAPQSDQAKQSQLTKNNLLSLNSDNPFDAKQPVIQTEQPKVADLNPQIKEAKKKLNEQYKKPVNDVDNYYSQDLKKLEDEIAKGNTADTNKVKGLMQSLDNRRKELNEYKTSRFSNKKDGFNIFDAGSWGKNENFRDFKNDRKEQAEKKQEADTNSWLTTNGDIKLNSGTTINKFVDEYNNADAFKQADLRRDAENKLNSKDEKEKAEAAVLLTAIEAKGNTRFNLLQKGRELGAGLQQGAVKLADATVKGGTTLEQLTNDLKGGTEEEKNKRLQETTDTGEKIRDWLKSGKDISGNNFTGSKDIGLDDIRKDPKKALELAGESLDIGLTATSLVNPARTAANAARGQAGRQALKFGARDAAFFGSGDAIATGATVYGETGDANKAVEAAVKTGITSAITQGGLEAGGYALGRGVRRARGITRADLQGAGTPSERPNTDVGVVNELPEQISETRTEQPVKNEAVIQPLAEIPRQQPDPVAQQNEVAQEVGLTQGGVEQLQSEIAARQEALLAANPTFRKLEDGSIVDGEANVVSESPEVVMQKELDRLTAEQASARQAQDEAAAQQAFVAPEEQTTAPNDAPGQSRGLDKEAIMQRLQARRDAFNADQDAATMAASQQSVNREADYDPVTPTTPEQIASQLQELGVDPRGFDGVTLTRLNNILQNTDWSKVSNPGGYIRTTLRNMVDANANTVNIPNQQLATRQPMLNERGEVMTDTEGNIMYQTDTTPDVVNDSGAKEPIDAPEQTAGFDREQLDQLTGIERADYVTETTGRIVAKLEDDLQRANSDPDTFFNKLAQVRRGEAEASILTPEELQVNTNLQQTLGDAINYAEEVSGTTFGRQGGEFYAPEYKTDRGNLTSSQQFIDQLDVGELAGSTYQNKRAIDTADLDTSTNPITSYLNEMYLYGGRNTPEANQANVATALAREAEADGRIVDASFVNKAADEMVELQDAIKTAATMGKNERVGNTVKNLFRGGDKIEANLYKIPVAQKLADIGRKLNKPQVLVTAQTKGFTLGEKVDNLQIGNSTLGEQGIRINQNAEAIANAAFDSATANGDIITSAIEPIMDRLEYIPDNDRRAIIDNLNQRIFGLENMTPDEMRTAQVAEAKRTLRNAAKANLIELAQRTQFDKASTQKAFNDAVNPLLVNDKIQQGYTDTILNTASSYINAALRGYNPKSAATELGDFGEINTVAGNINVMLAQRELLADPRRMVATMERYGRLGGLDPKADWAKNNQGTIARIMEAVNSKKPIAILKTIADPLALVKGVTLYKESVALNALERYWTGQGFQGTQLAERVLKDYYETVLPSSTLNRSWLNDSAGKRLMFQYMNWQVMNVKRTARMATGNSNAGRLSEMQNGKGAATYLANGGMTKAGLWAIQNTLFGTTIGSAFGIFDPANVLSGDYTQIGDEEKTILDRAMQVAGFSPFTGLFENAYSSIRREQERAEAVRNDEYTRGDPTDPNYNPDNAMADFLSQGRNFMFPGALQFNRTNDFVKDSEQGFAENDQGRIQYQTPEQGSLDWFRGLIGGGGATRPAREYNDSPDLLNQNPIEAISKDQMIDNFFDTRDYNRPLSATTYAPGYSDMAKDAHAKAVEQYGVNSKEARGVLAEWIEDGREYNRLYDKFGKDNPEQFKRWTDTYGDDVLTPEKWRTFDGNPEIFQFMKNRRAMEERDLGRAIDPVYKLPDEQAKQVLQERSAYTGDDMRLREFLYQTDWYGDFKEAEGKYYDSFGTADSRDKNKSERVKTWNKLSEAAFSPDKGIATKYPLVAQQKEINNRYGFGSAESRAWFSANGNAYKQQKQAYEQERFGIVNEMRKLEGVEPLTVEQYMAKIDFPEQDENGVWTGGKFGSGSSGYRKSGGGYSSRSSKPNDYNKINYVDERGSSASAAPDVKKMTKVKLKVKTSVGSRKPKAKITLRDLQRSRVKEKSI